MKNLLLILVSLLLMTCSKSDDIGDEIDLCLYTYVPDDNFERLLIARGYDNKMDDYVLTSNIKNIKELRAYEWSIFGGYGYGIVDLTGIKDFKSLEEFYCQMNVLTTLDLSQNTALRYLECSRNDLTALNVRQNTALISLDCSGNRLKSLDVSNNINLSRLIIGESIYDNFDGNDITNIDISNNLNLEYFDCGNNNLTQLDISNNNQLEHLYCRHNSLLECIQANQIQILHLDCWLASEAYLSLDCNY